MLRVGVFFDGTGTNYGNSLRAGADTPPSLDVGGGRERMIEQVLLRKPQSNLVPSGTPVERARVYAIAAEQLADKYAKVLPRPHH